jgi:flagellar hook-associated protein 2
MISFSGLATGLDTTKLISQLVKAEGAPIDRLKSKQSLIDARSRKVTTLRTRLDDLRNAALSLDSRREALPATLTSSNTARVRGSVVGGSPPARFDLEVVSLAKGARMYSSSFASSAAAGLFGTGQLQITTSAGTSTVDVDGSDTLETVRQKIQDLNLPLTASVLNDGAGFRLQLSGSGVGAANAVTVNEVGTGLGLALPANVVSAASDATFRIDGITMTRGSNTVSDAFPGVTLELLSASPAGEQTSIEIGNDPAALEAALKKVVDAYNAVNSFVQGESTWTGQQKPADSLSGDSMLRSVQSKLRSVVSAPVAGVSGSNTTLASLGVSLRRDGSLALESSKLRSALASNPEGVAQVLGTAGTGAMALLAEQADYFTDGSDGVLTRRLDSMGSERRSIDDRIARMQARLDKYESQLTQQYAKLEQVVSGLQGQGQRLSAALGSLR